MASEHLLVERSAGVATVVLNRPDRLNALDNELRDTLVRRLADLALDSSVRCIVLSGRGASFCAGGDLRAPAQDDRPSGAIEQDLRRQAGVTEAIYTMPKPVIALLRGHVIGGGLGIALACDLRIGTPTTQLRTGYLNLGLSGDFGISYLLPEAVGAVKAREMALLDATTGGEDALALGLLTELVPDAALEGRGAELGQRLAALPGLAVAKLKENLAFAARHDLRDAIYHECANIRIVVRDRNSQAFQAPT